MKFNQYAVYRVDQTTPGRELWHLSYEEAKSKKLLIQSAYYKQQWLEQMTPNDTAITIWNRNKDRMEVSDVIVINQDGELNAYYVSENHISLVSGFIRWNTSGALIFMDTTNYHFEDRNGSWMATDYIIIDGKQFFLMEHEKYGRQVPGVILDAYGKIIADKVRHGFDEASIQQIKNQIRAVEKPKVTIREQAKERYEIWQKYYVNGEYLRAAESGGEANYDMVDGQVNNQKKQAEKPAQPKKKKKRESVIHKLHKKQIEIAIRSGKPVPKYLEQNRELNRR